MSKKVGKEGDASDFHQTLPEWQRVLSNEQITALSKYQHKGSKTSYESWLQTGFCSWAEKAHPDFLSANAITIIGQIPLQLMVFATFWFTGSTIGVDNGHSSTLMILSGCALMWFSLYDIMDGNRARRLKCGSPLGRLIDEGGDAITQSNYSLLCAYAWFFSNPVFEICLFSLNFVFAAMETRYTVTGELVMAVGEFSPVEIESLFSLMFVLFGIYGNGILDVTVGASLGIPAGSKCPLHMICEYKWGFVLGCVLTLAVLLLIYDAIVEALSKDWKRSLTIYFPNIICLGLFLSIMTLPSYVDQRGVVYLQVNYTMSVVVLNLMLHNMTGYAYPVLQPSIGFLVVPLLAFHVGGVSAETEKLLTQAMTVLAWCSFQGKMALVARQWCDFKGVHFWTTVPAIAKKD